jgi:hypothetical protein
MHVVEEEIFTVAYDVIKFSYRMDIRALDVRRKVVPCRPVMAQARNLAFGDDGDDEIQSSGDDGE